MANRNTLWASILVEELAKAGLSKVCLAPGSRSTPLVLAFAAQPEITVYTHLDERSAGFFALGMAKALQKPVALLCTSGTAAANFYPAVVEAHQAGVPLIALTADRPFELRDSGANQSIDQVGMYGRFALWAVDVTLPEQQPSAQLIRSLRTLAARAYATANGARAGVVQLNLPFRKPLEPTEVKEDVLELPPTAEPRPASFTQILSGKPQLSRADITPLLDALSNCRNGLIVCGVDSPRTAEFAKAIQTLSEQTGFPILADATSGVRFAGLDVLSGFDSYLALPNVPKAECLLRFGRAPTSAALQHYLLSCDAKENWQISMVGMWADEEHTLTRFIQTEEVDFCRQLSAGLAQRKHQAEAKFKVEFERLEQATWDFWDNNLPKHYFDGTVVHALVKILPENSVLFTANSLSVRHLEQFGHSNATFSAYANRGASGIDGNVSTALGLGAATLKPLYMLIGDLTLYHDMNGLWGLRHLKQDVTIVLLNNNGGGIFRRLPIAEYEPEFERYFLTPPDLDFSYVAKLYRLEHHLITSLNDFRNALTAEHPRKLIEVQTNSSQDAAIRTDLLTKYQTYMEEL